MAQSDSHRTRQAALQAAQTARLARMNQQNAAQGAKITTRRKATALRKSQGYGKR